MFSVLTLETPFKKILSSRKTSTYQQSHSFKINLFVESSAYPNVSCCYRNDEVLELVY